MWFEDKEELEELSKMMEEMASLTREALGKREPGERCMYEIQRIENEDNKNKQS